MYNNTVVALQWGSIGYALLAIASEVEGSYDRDLIYSKFSTKSMSTSMTNFNST